MYLTQSNQIRGLSEVRIIPRNNGQFFHIQYVYERPSETVELDRDKALSVDIGLNNLASCVDTDGASFLVDGKKLKSINRLYNKESQITVCRHETRHEIHKTHRCHHSQKKAKNTAL